VREALGEMLTDDVSVAVAAGVIEPVAVRDTVRVHDSECDGDTVVVGVKDSEGVGAGVAVAERVKENERDDVTDGVDGGVNVFDKVGKDRVVENDWEKLRAGVTVGVTVGNVRVWLYVAVGVAITVTVGVGVWNVRDSEKVPVRVGAGVAVRESLADRVGVGAGVTVGVGVWNVRDSESVPVDDDDSVRDDVRGPDRERVSEVDNEGVGLGYEIVRVPVPDAVGAGVVVADGVRRADIV